MGIKINEGLLDGKLAGLEKARSWSPRVVSGLGDLIRHADDFSLFRINPVRFGVEKNVPEKESIDLFLYGTKFGLFEMNWQLLCPGCGDVVQSFNTLKNLHSHYRCNLCQKDFEAVLDDYIEISFTVSPSVREITFHNPESLSAEDYFFKYVFSRGAVYPDGTRIADVIRSLVKILTYLEPREKREFELEIPRGFLVGHDRLNHAELFFSVSGEAKTETQKLSIKLAGGKFEPGGGEISPGKFILDFENQGGKRGALLLIHEPHDYSSPGPLLYQPFLSGKRLLNTQTFRDLFRSEVIQGGEGIGVKDITILFTDLKESTSLYDDVGDLKAFALVRQHFDSLAKVVGDHSGAIVKTIGDAVMATFLNPVDAVKAALAMLAEIEHFNQELRGKTIKLKIGIHKGPSIAVTLNDRLDYFGQTVNISSRVQRLADAEDICVSHDVYTCPGVEELLKDFEIIIGKTKLKGIQEEVRVYKINPSLKKVAVVY